MRSKTSRNKRMNNKHNNKSCTCDKCGAQEYSMPGRLHRRCPAKKDSPLRGPENRLKPDERGTWQDDDSGATEE